MSEINLPCTPEKSKCPVCKKMTEFRFHFDIPPGPKECFPNECLSCGIFCNYRNEIYKGANMSKAREVLDTILEKLNENGLESLTIEDRTNLVMGGAKPTEEERIAIAEILEEVFNRR